MKTRKSKASGLSACKPSNTKSGGSKVAPARRKKTAPRPASLTAQRAWAGFSTKLKKELRRTLPDTDKDGVPDGFDCKPRNRRRQESFMPVDAAYLSKNPEIRPGKKLGEGYFGEVFSVAGNRNLVLKVPRLFTNTTDLTNSERKEIIRSSEEEIAREYEGYEAFGCEQRPLFIPTRAVKLEIGGVESIGLVRPKVAPVRDNSCRVKSFNKRRVTDAALMDLRRKLIQISSEGFVLWDGLQLGIDTAGRFLVYDLGDLKKVQPGSDKPFVVNNARWRAFLADLGKTPSEIQRYGEIAKE